MDTIILVLIAVALISYALVRLLPGPRAEITRRLAGFSRLEYRRPGPPSTPATDIRAAGQDQRSSSAPGATPVETAPRDRTAVAAIPAAAPAPALAPPPAIGTSGAAQPWNRRESLATVLRAPFAALCRYERGALWVLFVAALLLRVLYLETVPNTATADELDFSRDLMSIFTGHGPGFFGFDWTPEPALSIYLMSVSWHFFGMTLFAERLVTAVLTALAIFPFYALARRLYSAPASYLATALFAASRWYLLFSRSAWNNGHIVLYMLCGAWAVTVALERRQLRYWVLFGASLAALLYGYFSGRTVVIAFLCYLVIVLGLRWRGTERGGWRPVALGSVVAIVVCAVLFAPQVPNILAHLDQFNERTSSVYIFNQPLAPGQTKFDLLRDQFSSMIRSFVFMDGSLSGGPVGGRYKGLGDGWLDAITTVLYLIGMFIALIRYRRFVLWWCLFVIPLCLTQLLSTGAPDGARGLQAVVPMYIFVGAAIEALLAWRGWARLTRAHWLVAAGALAVCVYNVVSYVQYVDSPYAQSVRQPAVPVASFYIWRDYQLSRLHQNLGTLTAGAYDALPPSAIANQIFDLQPSTGTANAP